MNVFRIFVSALLGAIAVAGPCTAQVSIRLPFVRIETGGYGGTYVRAPFVRVQSSDFGGTHVRAPFIRVNTPPQVPVIGDPLPPSLPPVQPGVPVPAKPPIVSKPVPRLPVTPPGSKGPILVLPPKYVHAPGKALSHHEFARIFRPVPGEHTVDLIHPGCAGRIVRVCFTLPPGCPRVCTGRRYLTFDYGRCEVEIRFRLFGRVTVDYDD